MTILEVQHAAKRFGTADVLRDVSFALAQGETLAIIGASGSGKTTLLRCLNFLETLDEGRILVRGETIFDAANPSRDSEGDVRRKRLHFGLVFQNFNLFPQYTALENIALAQVMAARRQKGFQQNKKSIMEDIDREALALLARIGLADKRDFYPHQLSGGQQQRVAIARALALQPDILCFDEPTSALDPELTGEVLKVIRGLAEQHMTMIVVTHEMLFARQVADAVLFLDEGAVAGYGAPEDMLDRPPSERMRRFLERYA